MKLRTRPLLGRPQGDRLQAARLRPGPPRRPEDRHRHSPSQRHQVHVVDRQLRLQERQVLRQGRQGPGFPRPPPQRRSPDSQGTYTTTASIPPHGPAAPAAGPFAWAGHSPDDGSTRCSRMARTSRRSTPPAVGALNPWSVRKAPTGAARAGTRNEPTPHRRATAGVATPHPARDGAVALFTGPNRPPTRWSISAHGSWRHGPGPGPWPRPRARARARLWPRPRPRRLRDGASGAWASRPRRGSSRA